MPLKKILDFADKATKNGFKILVILFALALLFSGCRVGASNYYPEIIEEEETELTCLTEEEAEPAFLDLGEFRLTAYCACKKCCGKSDGITASGAKVQQGITVAADTDILPFGTKVIINDHEYTVQDCGGAIKGNRIDVYFDSHEEALEFGVQYANVFISLTAENGGEEI